MGTFSFFLRCLRGSKFGENDRCDGSSHHDRLDEEIAATWPAESQTPAARVAASGSLGLLSAYSYDPVRLWLSASEPYWAE